VTANGVTYRAILLGVNQTQSSPFLSLDELRLYVSDSATVSGYDATTHQLGGLTASYDLGDNWIKLNSALSHGNGSGDMYVFVPDSVLASATNPDPYVYLYSKFGVHFGANGGFEQWAPGVGGVLPPSVVPLPAGLSGFVYADANRDGVRQSAEPGLSGITITLTGFDANGKPVTQTTVTLGDGSYAFKNLAAGTYQISVDLPPFIPHGMNSVGTVNGQADGTLVGNSAIGSITLTAGDLGTEYDFAVLSVSG
jgi:SdrD B-like domain